MCVSDRKHSIKTGRPGTGGMQELLWFQADLSQSGVDWFETCSRKKRGEEVDLIK